LSQNETLRTIKVVIQTESLGEDIKIKFTRDLDESAQFPVLKVRLSQRIIFDCHQLNTTSSYGLQKWIEWMRSYDSRIQFIFRGCRDRIINALNSVEGFAPAEMVVESFYMPFLCHHCGHEEEILLTRGKDYIEALDENARFLAPDMMNCPRCREPMEVAVLEKKYLQFLHAKKIK
jgi:hypothetical protein